MPIMLRPVRESEDSFLFELYASARAAELALVPWIDAQRQAFLSISSLPGKILTRSNIRRRNATSLERR